MKKGILIIALTLFFGLTSAFSQGHFSTDKSAFVGELSTYLNSSTSKQDREEAAVVMKGFGGVWNSYYSDSEANTIIGLCNLLHAKSGGKGYANIFNLVEVLQRIPTGGLTHSDVSNWLTFTNAKAQKSMNGMDKYLASCRNIFVDKVLSAKGNSKWTVRDALWSFPSKERFELSIDGTLALMSQKDESLLKNTKGVYYLDDNHWEGMGGRADWSRFDIPADKVYVTLPDFYRLDLNRSEYAIDSVIFHIQQTGQIPCGEGIVCDGHLCKGRLNYAGEMEPVAWLMGFSGDPYEMVWTYEGMTEIVANYLCASICTVSPDAVYVAAPLVRDMDELREWLWRTIPMAYVPELRWVSDYRELVYLGELAPCIQKLTHPRPHRKW